MSSKMVGSDTMAVVESFLKMDSRNIMESYKYLSRSLELHKKSKCSATCLLCQYKQMDRLFKLGYSQGEIQKFMLWSLNQAKKEREMARSKGTKKQMEKVLKKAQIKVRKEKRVAKSLNKYHEMRRKVEEQAKEDRETSSKQKEEKVKDNKEGETKNEEEKFKEDKDKENKKKEKGRDKKVRKQKRVEK